MRSRFIIIIIFLSFPLMHCHNPSSRNTGLPISADKFTKIYTEMLLLKYSKLSQTRKDSLMISVLKKSGFTRNKYDQCEAYFKQNPEEWLKVIDKADINIRALTESDSLTDRKKIDQITPK